MAEREGEARSDHVHREWGLHICQVQGSGKVTGGILQVPVAKPMRGEAKTPRRKEEGSVLVVVIHRDVDCPDTGDG